MTADRLEIEGVRVPRMLYGTAWKEARTRPLTELALKHGFRGIDTANQRRHYDEAAVGDAVRDAMENREVERDALFLQTKFTFRGGQDHRLPYDPQAPIARQVEQSVASSLEHLHVDNVDSYLLHGPSSRAGLTDDDWEAWRAMEAAHGRGQARLLGASNVSLEQIQLLCDRARVRPRFVQNRCYAALGWDQEVRRFCAANGIVYQGFSLLTANRPLLSAPYMQELARRYDRSVPEIVFRFALDADMIPLTGTTSAAHMQADLGVFAFSLEPDEVARVERLAVKA